MRVRVRHRNAWWCLKCHRPLRRVGPDAFRPDHLGLGGPRGHWDAPMSISACGKKKGAPKAPPHRSVPRTATAFPGRCIARSCINHVHRSTGEGRVGQIRSRCALVVSGARASIVCRWRMDPAGDLVKNPVGNHAPCKRAEYWAPPSCKETRCEDRGNRWHRMEFAEAVNAQPWPPRVQPSRERGPVCTPVEPERAHNREVARVPDVRQVMIHVDQNPTGEERTNPGDRPSSAPEWHGQHGGSEGVVWRKHHQQG